MVFKRRYLGVLSFALIVQALAVLIGFYILYFCTSRGIPQHNLSETLYWGTLGILGFITLGMAAPLTVIVLAVMSVLISLGLKSKRVWFLWPIGFLLWGLFWVAMAYEICAPPLD